MTTCRLNMTACQARGAYAQRDVYNLPAEKRERLLQAVQGGSSPRSL